MTRRFEQCLSIGRKKVLFGIALVYILAFLIVQHRYGWSFSSFVTSISERGRAIMSSGPQENLPVQDLVLGESQSNSSSSAVHIQHRPIDVHFEDPVLGHTGEASGHADHGLRDTTNHIAIGGGITSKKLDDVNPSNMKSKFQFFSILMPSFCRTVTPGYHYHFYLAYDTSDPVFSDQGLLGAFNDAFYSVSQSLCPPNLNTSLHFVQCSHQGRPAWAQNDAMIEAYLDGMEYFYRVNDDSILESSGWAEEFVRTLAGYDPPNVGVVGPKHLGGNELILTYDFVHRTHLEVFGFYYPRVFTDWYADDWVTKVYMPGRMTKLSHIHLKHTMTLGQRYKNDFSIYPKLELQLKADKLTLSRYISYKKQGYTQPSLKQIVAMSLYGNIPKYTMGAIRNAQTIPMFFPGWSLRVYVAKPSPDLPQKSWIVPGRIIAKLKSLGAQIAYVDLTHVKLEPQWWSHLVADDPNVDYFIVRGANARLSDRDAAAVFDWVTSTKVQSAFHCIRDHPRHGLVAVESGLWGGRGEHLHRRLGPGMNSLLHEYVSNHSAHAGDGSKAADPSDFLSKIVWPLVQDVAFCHDSVSCKNWPNTYSFPVERYNQLQFVGQLFNENQEVEGGLDPNELVSVTPDCTGKGKWQPVAKVNLPTPMPILSDLQSVERQGNMTNSTLASADLEPRI